MNYFQLIKLEKLLSEDIKIFENLLLKRPDAFGGIETFIAERRIIYREIKDSIASYTNQDISALKKMVKDGKKGYHKLLKPSNPNSKPWQ